MGSSRGKTSHHDMSTVECIVNLAALSHIGMKRASNQDSFCALVGSDAPSGSDALLAVADGMGGHKAGEVASEMAIRGLIDGLSRGDLRSCVTDDLYLIIKQTFGGLNTEIHTAAGSSGNPWDGHYPNRSSDYRRRFDHRTRRGQ